MMCTPSGLALLTTALYKHFKYLFEFLCVFVFAFILKTFLLVALRILNFSVLYVTQTRPTFVQ